MKIVINKLISCEYEAHTLEIDAYFRYPEDASYWDENDIEHECDNENPEIPCFDGHNWKPIIDINTGKILNWDKPYAAYVFGKICDEFCCKVKGINGEVLIDYEGYVPDCMAILSNGFGDYIDMMVNSDGIIQDWNFTQQDIEFMTAN